MYRIRGSALFLRPRNVRYRYVLPKGGNLVSQNLRPATKNVNLWHSWAGGGCRAAVERNGMSWCVSGSVCWCRTV